MLKIRPRLSQPVPTPVCHTGILLEILSQDHLEVRSLTFSGKDYAPSISPDGRTVAFVSECDGRRCIWIKQIETGAENPVTEGSDSSPHVSPNGNWILFTRAEVEA